MFKNEALTDFTEDRAKQEFASALEALDHKIKSAGLRAVPLIDGKVNNSSKTLKSLDPSSPKISLGDVELANEQHVAAALESLKKGAPKWRDTKFSERARLVREVGTRIRARKFEFAALLVREAGKTWREADGDVAEAIDFCEYYASEMLRLGPAQLTQEVPGEENIYFYQPRGICVVIAPWNFPLAIACGMVVAALVTGNATILKPSEQTSIVAAEFSKLMLEVGIPGDAYAFLPGVGEEIGRLLVNSPLVDMICFTGSKSVGLEIIEKSAHTDSKQANVKRVVAEMGGKNAVIIDSDADLDEAIKGVRQAAFGYAGQKCSACSRLIVVGDAYEPFLKRFAEAVEGIIGGEASDPATFLGPVIDQESQQRILKTIDSASKDFKILAKSKVCDRGYFVPATVFRDVDSKSPLWREEIFGPVVACLQARDFNHALALANDSEYALTGGVFSRSPENIERAKREFRVGNLYINRACTGALVQRQPFGGFRMSGIGSKAGGPDYLIQFMEPRTVTENTMRRGFAA